MLLEAYADLSEITRKRGPAFCAEVVANWFPDLERIFAHPEVVKAISVEHWLASVEPALACPDSQSDPDTEMETLLALIPEAASAIESLTEVVPAGPRRSLRKQAIINLAIAAKVGRARSLAVPEWGGSAQFYVQTADSGTIPVQFPKKVEWAPRPETVAWFRRTLNEQACKAVEFGLWSLLPEDDALFPVAWRVFGELRPLREAERRSPYPLVTAPGDPKLPSPLESYERQFGFDLGTTEDIAAGSLLGRWRHKAVLPVAEKSSVAMRTLPPREGLIWALTRAMPC